MSPHRVINLRQLLAENAAPDSPERELASWLGTVVECATATSRDEVWLPVSVACRACAPANYRVTALRRVGPGIEWLCSSCRASGTLLGWQGTPSDLSAHAELSDDTAYTAPLFARLDELTWLRPHVSQVMLRALLARAHVEREHVVLLVDAKDLSALLSCAERSAREAIDKERYALERFVGRCDALRAMLEREAGTGASVLH